MAYFDPNDEQNKALMKLGYEPISSAPPSTPLSAPAQPPSVQVTPPPAVEQPPAAKPEPPKENSGTSAQDAGAVFQSLANSTDPENPQGKAMRKVGGLISTVLSAYTGNAAGVAGGVSGMKGG